MSLIRNKFIVPAYYRYFSCLCGACRHSCCEGLEVNITQDEYFRLAGIGCSEKLRERLDLAIHPLEHPDENRYACLSPDFFGRCRMLDENGLCLLQSECGFDALARACRYYPRKPDITRMTCSMSNACDETLLLLMQDDLPWGYETEELEFDLIGTIPQSQLDLQGRNLAQSYPQQTDAQDTRNPELCIRQSLEMEKRIIHIILNSSSPLIDRLKDIERVISPEKDPAIIADINSDVIRQFLANAGEQYGDMAEYTANTIRMMGMHPVNGSEDLGKVLSELEDAVDSAVPKEHLKNFKQFFAKVIANSIFYSGFPFIEGKKPMETLPVFQAVVVMLLLLSAANLDEHTTREDIIDLYASFFRMVDLTDFGRIIRAILQNT